MQRMLEAVDHGYRGYSTLRTTVETEEDRKVSVEQHTAIAQCIMDEVVNEKKLDALDD